MFFKLIIKSKQSILVYKFRHCIHKADHVLFRMLSTPAHVVWIWSSRLLIT